MTAGRYVDRTRADDATFEEARARWEAAEAAEEAWGYDPCADGCDPANVQQVAADEDQCSVCGLRGPIGEAS